MAKLRAFARGLRAAGQSLGDIIARQDALAKEERLRKAAIALEQLQHTNTMARVQEQEREQLRRQFLSNPEQAERLQSSGQTIPGLDLSRYGRSPRERIAPLREAVDTATTPEGVPSAPGLMGRAGAEGVDTSTTTVPMPMGGGTFPVANRPDIRELMRARQEKEATTRQAVLDKAKAQPHVIPGTMQKGREVGGETLFEELSPTQKGQATLQEAEAGELSPAYAVAKARVDNMLEKATRDEKVRTAGAMSGAQMGASRRAALSPDIVKAEVAREQEMAAARARGEGTVPTAGGAGSTDAERRASAQFVQLLNTHAISLEKEQQRAALPPALVEASRSPLFNVMAGGAYSQLDREYAQSALNFANIYTYILSGAATRAEERPTYLTNFFRITGDPASVAEQKRQAREMFITATQIQVGRGAKAAGHALGRALEGGIITPEQLVTFKYRPEIVEGILEIVKLPPEIVARIK